MAENLRNTSSNESVDRRRSELVKEALRQEERCLWTSTIFYIWLRRVRFHHRLFISIPIILGAIAGFSVLKEAIPPWIIASLALIASLFPALADALKIETSVDEIARAAAEYKALEDRFRQLALITALGSLEQAEGSLAELMDRMDATRGASLTPPEKYFELARKKIDAGNYKFSVD